MYKHFCKTVTRAEVKFKFSVTSVCTSHHRVTIFHIAYLLNSLQCTSEKFNICVEH